tara:strand:- start:5323 stop:5691 length:369 start_codon:yes stop_codon:yes gene_type:complete
MFEDDVHERLTRLEDTDRQLTQEVNKLQNKLDNALLTLTNNVNNLTNAIHVLQESQAQNTALHHSMIVLQERASVIPKVQEELNRVVVDQAAQRVILTGIKFLCGAVLVAVLGGVATLIFGA